MARVSVEWLPNWQNTTGIFGVDAYSSSKLMMGNMFNLYTGSTMATNYVAPYNILYSRVGELSGLASSYPHAVSQSSRYNFIFTFDVATAALTRRVHLTIHDRVNQVLNYQGNIVLNFFNISGNKIIRGGRGIIRKITRGQCSVSGSTVTGNGTQFLLDGACIGGRIGFGSNNSDNITTWYDITAIASDTSLTISGSPGTLSNGDYIIEELELALAITNATVANGGLFLVKGLNPGLFSLTPTTINEVNNKLDNQRGIYWLRDAATETNTIAAGLALEDELGTGSQMAYIVNADTTARTTIFKYNLRANLSGSFGAATPSGSTQTAFILRTGQATLAASHVVSQANNGRFFTVQSGGASGASSLYFTSNFTSTSRVNRVDTTGIISGSTSWITDTMLEVPPGGVSTFPLTNAMGSADYSTSIDRLIIPTTSTPYRVYSTPYVTDGSQFENIFLNDNNFVAGTSGNVNATVFPNARGAAITLWTEAGWLYMMNASTTTLGNILYAIPVAADWNTADTASQYVITPKIATPNASKLYRALIGHENQFGASLPLGGLAEAFAIYVRTSGIDDNAGSWTLVEDGGDISGIAASTYIQFKLIFRTMGNYCLPNRIYNINVMYENDSQDSHYQPSLTQSSTANRIFAWKQIVTWGSAIPNMKIRLYDADLNTEVLNDNSSGPAYGTWQYSANSGSSWNTWDTGADSVGNYIRYTANSVPNNITVRVLLTQA